MTTKPTFLHRTLLIVHCSLILLLAACATQTTQPTTQSIPPRDSIRQDVPSDTSPTVENPLLYLDITITDAQTGQPVSADVTIDDGTEYAVTSLQVVVAANHPHTITVTAPGYKLWDSTLRTNLHHHKRMELSIKLEPLKDTG